MNKITAWLFVGLLLLLHGATPAQVTHRNLLAKYSLPVVQQLLLPQNNWKPFPQTPEQWKALLPDTVLHSIIVNGEKALQKEFPAIPATVMLEFVRNGNRTDYEALSFARRNQLFSLVLAESVEGKGRFTDQIVNGIWSICEESFWGVSAHLGMQKAGAGLPDVEDPVVDLFAAETAAVLAWTDYFTGPQLDKVSKLVRPRIYYEVNRRVLQPMTTAHYGWMGNGNPEAKLNNWAPWIMSNYAVTALLLEKDAAKRAQAVYTALKITDQYMNGLGEDGGCDEGPSYWFAAGGAVFDVLDVVHDASKEQISIFSEPFVQKMAAYIYKTHIAGNYFVNVADAHPQMNPDGVMLYRFGKAIHDDRLTGFGSWIFHQLQGNETPGLERFHRTRWLYNLFALKSIAGDHTPYQPVTDAWFDDVQLMTAHLPNGLFVSAHGGNNNESHNHNDIGDFTVYAGADPVIIDVGSGTYTARTFSKDRYRIWFNTSPYHNLPTISNQQQQAGAAYLAADVQYRTSSKASILSMNLQKAYPAATGISSWKRSVVAGKNGQVQVTDSYQAAAPLTALTQSFMTVCTTDISQPGVIRFTTAHGEKLQLQYNARFWTATIEKMGLQEPEDQGLKANWNHQDIYRILLTAKILPSTAELQYLITR